MTIQVRHFGGSLWGIKADAFSPTLRDVGRGTPGMRFDYPLGAWVGYADAVAVALVKCRKLRLRVQGEVTVNDAVLTLPIARKGLREYQIHGVEWAVSHVNDGALIADDVGLGKTAQAIRTARAMRGDASFTLIVCPSFVRGVWETEVPKWWPEAKLVGLAGTKPTKLNIAFDDADIVLVHYDVLHAWTDWLLNSENNERVSTLTLNGIIFDEIHMLMSEKSRRSAAARTLARRAKWRLGLSGTPMTSRPKDLWNILDTLSEGRFGKPFDFYRAHCGLVKEQVTREKAVWKYDGATRLDELQARLNAGIMLRRTKSEVQLELPARTRQVMSLDVGRNYLISPAAALGDDKALHRALALAADGKLPDVAEMAAQHVAEGHNVVLGCHRKAIAENLAERLMNVGVQALTHHGDLSIQERERRIALKPKVLCVTIDSCYQGISLAYADIAIIVELLWEPLKLLQFEGRFHRHGQLREVLFQYPFAKGSIDEIIGRAIEKKLDTFEASIGKLDDGLKEDLKATKATSNAAAMRALYDELRASLG